MNFNDAYEICTKKAKLHFQKLNNTLFEPPESASGDYYENYPDPNFDFVNFRGFWLTSMLTGLAPLLYQTKNDKEALKWSYQFAHYYHDKVFQHYTDTMHDLGFLYLPYSVHIYQLTGDTGHRDTAIKAADELAKRFNVKGRFIEAWGGMNDKNRQCRIIVDTCMNVALLYWAWQETGHDFYRWVADAHLETTIDVLVRDDYSVAHSWIFDRETGEPAYEANDCGYDNGSHWARGTAWLVYGLAIAYSYTKNEKFLDVATKAGEKYLDSLTDGPIPPWDFRLPEDKPAVMCPWIINTPHWDETKPENRIYNVDTSAASIMSCGFMLINSIRKNERFENYADTALDTLCNQYLNTNLEITGMISRSNGRDAYTSFGDYYFMHALAMKLFDVKTCWQSKDI